MSPSRAAAVLWLALALPAQEPNTATAPATRPEAAPRTAVLDLVPADDPFEAVVRDALQVAGAQTPHESGTTPRHSEPPTRWGACGPWLPSHRAGPSLAGAAATAGNVSAGGMENP